MSNNDNAASPVEQPATAQNLDAELGAFVRRSVAALADSPKSFLANVQRAIEDQALHAAQPAPAPADERAAFEECIREHSDPDRFDDRIARQDGHYVEYATALAWAAWQARAGKQS